MAASDRRFANLGAPNAIWAIGAIHADLDRLQTLHRALKDAIIEGFRVVYLGNMVGHGKAASATLDEIIQFRTELIEAGLDSSDIVYLRGRQEEMWQKLLQLHFAPNPTKVLNWMIENGLGPMIEAYGGNVDHGRGAARTGATHLNRWITDLRGRMHDKAGHDGLFSALRRAAFTDNGQVLFVSAGFEADRPVDSQGDSLWWGHPGFEEINEPVDGFGRIVRGFDPGDGGVAIGPVSATLDGGCGRGGTLAAACISPTGEIFETLEV